MIVLLHSAGKQFANLLLTMGLLGSAVQVKGAADWSLPVTGNLLGMVTDSSGEPQMGASVELLNKYNRLISKTLSSTDGRFAFAGLASDAYAVRVSLTSFLPAFRDKIVVKAGANSLLQIHLSTLFSNIQLSSTIPTSGMSNDWKWVLRSSPATRPITRFLPDEESTLAAVRPQVFSGTHMSVGMSGGAGGLVDADSAGTDLGTRFAVSTNLFGKNSIQVAGSLGPGLDVGGNSFSLCAIYSRDAAFGFANAPEVTLTISQIGLATSQAGNAAGMLRTMSMSLYEAADPVEGMHLEYGMIGESVDYVQHSSRISPFARVSVDAGTMGTVVAAFSDGGRPDELTAHQRFRDLTQSDTDGDLSSSLSAVARVPQVSTLRGRLELQRTENFELGWDKTLGSRTYAVSAFHEDVTNGRLSVAGDLSWFASSDLLSDGVSRTSIYNVGNYQRSGYLTSMTQKVTDFADLDLGYGRMGGFGSRETTLSGQVSAGDFLKNANHNIASMAVHTRIAKTGTRMTAQYGWTDPRAVIPQHVFTTQGGSLAPGLNIYFRQPIPSFFGMPGRLELTGDLRNLLSDGYLPMLSADGRQTVIVEAPKAIRGGVSFTF